MQRFDPLSAAQGLNRRHFLREAVGGLGAAALASMGGTAAASTSGLHHAAKAKRIIYLFQSGAPSQFETLDPKPGLVDRFGGRSRAKQRGPHHFGYSGRPPLANLLGHLQAFRSSGIVIGDRPGVDQRQPTDPAWVILHERESDVPTHGEAGKQKRPSRRKIVKQLREVVRVAAERSGLRTARPIAQRGAAEASQIGRDHSVAFS